MIKFLRKGSEFSSLENRFHRSRHIAFLSLYHLA
jgi:hypothetical protein